MAREQRYTGNKEKDESYRLASFWLDQVDEVDQLQKSWLSKGDDIIKRYRDERAQYESNRRRLNVLWANIRVLMPALYAKPPVPYVERRFLQRDPVAKLSSTILERVVKNEIEINGLHSSIRRAVLDYLLVGRGAVWVRYEPDIGEIGDSIPVEAQSSFQDSISDIEGNEDIDDPKSEKLEATGEQLLGEQIPVDHINWKDLYVFPATARSWEEIQAIGKRVYLSKEEAKERFGEEVAKNLRYTATNYEQKRKVPYTETAIFQSSNYRNIVVYEIWNKVDRKIYWVSEGYDYLCDVKDDFLELKEFFPIPKALFSTLTNESLVPVPDYIEYQDQAIQIDELTQRLAMLTKACKIAGCYDAANGSLKRLFAEGFENDLIPVDSWAAFAEKGGVQGGIALLPIEEIQKVIETLTKVRQQLMMDLDLVTGISDILRGTTDSRETLGGIRLKNNNAGTRLSDRQNEVAFFARDTIAIIAEIAAKHYGAQKLIESSNVLYDEDMQPEAIMEEFAPPSQSQNQQQGAQQNQQGNQIPAPSIGQANPFEGGINSIGNTPQGNNILPFPNINNKAQPAINSPMGTAPPQPFFQQPQVNPFEVIMSRLEQAIQLLRDDMPRGYRIDIETDSTIFGDAAQERQDAALFIGEVSKFMAGAAQLGQQLPEAVPALCQTLLWGIRKFRVGRDLESSFDDFINKVQKRTKEQLKNPQPDPEQQKAQAQIEGVKLKTQADLQKSQLDHQHQTKQNQQELQKQQADHALDTQMAQMDFQLKQEEHKMKMEELKLKHQLEMAKLQAQMQQMQMQTEMKGQEMQMNAQQSQQEHAQNMQMNEQQHNQNMQQTQMQGEQSREQHQQTMQQTKLEGQQAQQQHSQKIQQTKMAGQQAEAKHKQTMQQAKVKKKAGGGK